ncbi:hypothetical protein ABL78_8114 [Leptomonas seymouri]|uniref:Uncharacterized protein n=1 Tax=Leptomonas seymouri TaxID=5684 RepID=A0A0N1HZM0_LEPSE|nr:hypothetical protein ABL78_8114 [Leptomonas seymouri]|eukprot:KPI82873.1 hypothetical protein ABL78_8114 [Leptomonas seymouri]
MSCKTPNSFEEADVFHMFDNDDATGSPLTAAEAQGKAAIRDEQYRALVQMMASNLGLTADEAERLFPAYWVNHHKGEDEGNTAAGSGGAPNLSSLAAREPPLCAHLSREGVETYWSSSTADFIPSVRCCDARDLSKQEPFPATGHGPHVHCLYCFHSAIQNAMPSGRGALPPIVEDFRDSASLQAHQRTHRERYRNYLKLLDGCGSSDLEIGVDMLSDEGMAACEHAAENESRHVCYMAAMGTPACPVVVFYCAACDCFAPLVRLQPDGEVDGREEVCAWSSTEVLDVILSRLLLSFHLLYMMHPSRFPGHLEGAHNADGAHDAEDRQARHVMYLFKPVLLHEGVEAELIEEFEDDALCTHAAVVLPNATVVGEPAELLLLDSEEPGQGVVASGHDIHDSADSSPRTYSPVVIGFAMEWASEELLQSKVDLILRQHELGNPVAGAAVLPLHVATRRVYIEDTEEWVTAHVLYHRTVATRDELPCSYVDGADEGIRVVETYAIEAPMTEMNGASAYASANYSSSAIAPTSSNPAEDTNAEDPLALDGCPYSLESRTINFLLRMAALAKAMHEVFTRRLSIDENKEGPS